MAHVNDIALEFFGEEAMDESGRFVRPELVIFLRGMMTLTFNRWRSVFTRQIKNFHEAQDALKKREKGKC